MVRPSGSVTVKAVGDLRAIVALRVDCFAAVLPPDGWEPVEAGAGWAAVALRAGCGSAPRTGPGAKPGAVPSKTTTAGRSSFIDGDKTVLASQSRESNDHAKA
jgi:hypothetical protein